MNHMLRTVCAALAGILLMTACAEEKNTPYNENERLAFRAWMEINRPHLLDNYQAEGEYYVDVIQLGHTDTKPISDTSMWVSFTFTGRNLGGDIVLTRNEIEANQVGTYTKFTRYIPFYRYYAGDTNASLIEGTYLAMHNKLKLGETYAAGKGYPREVEMRYGTKVTLYMPSSVVSSTGVGGSGGYEGQQGYELKAGAPFVVTMQITDTVHNPLQREGADADKFAQSNGYLKPSKKKIVSAPVWRATRDDGPIVPPLNPNDPYNDGYEWRSAVDSIPHVYVSLIYAPTKQYKYPSIYQSIYVPYDNFSKLEQNICDTLVNRFGVYEGPTKLESDSVTLKGTAKIWYIGRFLDGFIFDTNIPGVRRLIYGETKTTGDPLSYKPESGSMIEAFYYSIPNLRYGQWASILTTSTNAYGATGTGGKTNTSSSGGSSYDYMNYYNQMNGYYGGSGYYNGYSDAYYSNYMNGLYSGSGNSTTTTTTTSISTEIPPFTPLLFQVYIEPTEE